MRIASSRLFAALTVALAVAFGFSSAVVAQNKKSVKTKPLKKKQKAKKGKKLKTQISLSDNVCGSLTKVGAAHYQSFERCGGAACPPSPREICRQVVASCLDEKTGVVKTKTGKPECHAKPAPSTTNPVQTQGVN